MSDEVKYPPSDVAGVVGKPFRKALRRPRTRHTRMGRLHETRGG